MGQTSTARKRWKERIKAGETILCAICNEPIPLHATGKNTLKNGGKGGLSVDHILPKALGGRSNKANLQPTHARCNHKKGAKLTVTEVESARLRRRLHNTYLGSKKASTDEKKAILNEMYP